MSATSTPTKRDAFIDPNFSMSMIVTPGSDLRTESAMQSVIEETIDESYLLGACAPSTSTPFDGQDIDSIDIKKVEASGPFLDGCVIFVAGFPSERREKLNKILNFSGAMNCLTLNERITHAIIGNPKCPELKQIASKHLPCTVVSVAWLLESMHQQMPADVDKYLLHCDSSSERNSLEGGTSSPLSKEGLNFLRADVTIPDVEPEKASVTRKQEQDVEDCALRHYLNSMQGHNSVDDAFPAYTLNPTPSEKNAIANPAEATSPSISTTIDESIVPAFADIKFVVLNYPQVQEDIIIEQIRGMQGTIVGADYQGVIDYAIVPIDKHSVEISVCNVVTYLWVAECVEKKRLITECEYHHLPFTKTLNVLHGLCISISGVDTREKEFLSNVITQLGGIEQDCMARREHPEKNTLATTHLICNEPSGKKYQGALKWGLPVLHRAWLFKCAEEERRVDEGDFLLGPSKVKVNASTSTSTLPECQQPATFATLIGKRMFDEVDVNATSSKECQQPATFTTPIQKRMIDEDDVCTTPNNTALPSCSQITPANEIMARVRQMYDGFEWQSSPRTPVDTMLDDTMETPDTPYGRVFQDPPPPELRNKWKRWLDSIPTPKKDPSTPLSEIRRQLWAKVHESLRESPLPNQALHREFIQSELKKMFSERELDKENEPMDESTPADDTEGLNFLRADVTIPDVEAEKASVEQERKQEHDVEDCVLRHYPNSMQGHNSVVDALAAFALNPRPSEKNASANPVEATSLYIFASEDEEDDAEENESRNIPGPSGLQRITPRQPYSRQEEEHILTYIVTNEIFDARLRMMPTWERIAKYFENGRTAESLRERFRRYMLPRLEEFNNITNGQKNQILSGYEENKQRRTRQPTLNCKCKCKCCR